MIVRGYEPRDLEACRALFEELLGAHRKLYPRATLFVAHDFRTWSGRR